MKNYIALAHSTSAPVEPCRNRLNGSLLALLYFKLIEFNALTDDLDRLKRAIFYGKPEITGTMKTPEEAMQNALVGLASDQTIELLHAGLGMATEAGEFLQAIFSKIFHGENLDAVNLGEEIGDTLYYLAKAARATGTTLEMEMERNIAKLAKRYPNKFTEAAALNRNLEAERAVLESKERRAVAE